MQIQRRAIARYILFNCLTIGIYGFIVATQMNREINALCMGDGEKPRLGYAGAWGARLLLPLMGLAGLAIAGALIGFAGCLLAGLASAIWYVIAGGGANYAFGTLLLWGFQYGGIAGGCLGAATGIVLGQAYYQYWWYKQANRLHINANRYGLYIKERGTDSFLFRTALYLPLLPLTALLAVGAWLVPALIVALFSLTKASLLLVILLSVFAFAYLLFGSELTGGATISTFFIFKNLTRYADACRNGASPFDPMEYEYYPSVENIYARILPAFAGGAGATGTTGTTGEIFDSNRDDSGQPQPEPPDKDAAAGSIIGLKGSCAGYVFALAAGEEIVIGKDAKRSSIVVEAGYREISRKHVSITYDVVRDLYHVTDHSSNGTWANGQRLPPGMDTIQHHGTTLMLATDKNTFRLE